jgi:hypothetical protein
VAFAAGAQAQNIVNTGPGGSTSAINYVLGGGQQLAGQFQVSSATDITGINGWITTGTVYQGDTGVGGELDVSLFSDDSGSVGTSLFSGSTDLAGQLPYGWYGLTGLSWDVGPGAYWVVFGSPDGSPFDQNPEFGYMLSGPADPLSLYRVNNEITLGQWTNWNQSAGFGVQVTGSVPDAASTLLLLGAAVAMLAGARAAVRQG